MNENGIGASKLNLVAGEILPDFDLPSSDGRRIRPGDYRSHHNLVIVFAGDASHDFSRELLSGLVRQYHAVAREAAEVLAVVCGGIEEAEAVRSRDNLPFPVLADQFGRTHHAFGAQTLDGRAVAQAAYAVGRFGRIYFASRAADGAPLPTPQDIVSWLYFVEAQCPECGQSEVFE